MSAVTGEWHSELHSLLQNKPPEIPKGWFTTWDVALQWKIGYSAASKKLNLNFRLGKTERKQYPNPSGIGSPIYIYRIKKRTRIKCEHPASED